MGYHTHVVEESRYLRIFFQVQNVCTFTETIFEKKNNFGKLKNIKKKKQKSKNLEMLPVLV